MTHLHKASGVYFECGELMDFPNRGNRKTYDMVVITLWNDSDEDILPPVIIDYYFGAYDEKTTDYYIDRWFEKQSTNGMWRKFISDCKDIVDAYWLTNEDVLEEDDKRRVLTIRTGLENILEVTAND